MFVAQTQIFTDSGWKKIEDISGQDKVLVKNFIDDAEFIQPFAVKKKKYDGKIVRIGARRWQFSVTPDHPVIYDIDNKGKFRTVPAADVVATNHNRIHRRFKYMFSDEYRKELIKIRDDFGSRMVTISPYDWYKLVGYVLTRGFIRMKPGKPMLWLFLEENRAEEEIIILGDLLDRIGVGWHVQYSEKTRPKIVVSSKNTLAQRLITRLGSSTRKNMRLPDKMVYNSSKELTGLLIDTIIASSIKPETERTNSYQLATSNKLLIDSLVLLGTLGGYGMNVQLSKKAGTDIINGGKSTKDSYILLISSISDTYSPKYVKKELYSGYVYEIIMFEGQVYVKEGSTPVWTNPK